ncbi:MAG TPA: PqqD family protein [Bacteroidales bacterium]|nr:PqqD family protein [Bacteroidales bacterium]
MVKYLRNSQTISGRLSDELVMMDIDKGKYFSLNKVATRIWDLLERPMDLKELCDLLKSEYEVNDEQCLSEVKEHLDEMIKLGLVNMHEQK